MDGLLESGGAAPEPPTGSAFFRAGERILSPGSGTGRIFLIRSGRVRLWKPLPGSRRLTLGLLGPNDLFSQADGPGSTGELVATAVTDARVAIVALETLPDLLAVSPALSAAVVRGLIARVNGLQLLAEDLLTRDVPGRVAAALLRLAQDGGRAGRDGLTLLDFPADASALAEMVGGERGAVASALARLRADRAILPREPDQLLVDPARLYRHTRVADQAGRDQPPAPARDPFADRPPARALLGTGDAWFRILWNRTSDAIAISDPDGVVLAVNPAYADLYGYDVAQVVGQSFAIIFPPDYRETAVREYRQVFHGPPPSRPFEAQVVRADGIARQVESRVDFIVRGDQRLAMLSFVRDVTPST